MEFLENTIFNTTVMGIKCRTLWHFGHPTLSGERSACGVVDEDGYWRF